MTKAALENQIRNEILDSLANFINETMNTDPLRVSTSEIAVPVVDAEGNEKFALIKVSIPRGTRSDGGYEPYDGYAAADEYNYELQQREAKTAAREEHKKMQEAEKERKRAMRTKKVNVDELQQKLKEIKKMVKME